MAKLIDAQFLALEGGFLPCFAVGLAPAPGSVVCLWQTALLTLTHLPASACEQGGGS